MMDKNKLILPVYLNEKIIMDMLAIIEDGFSMVSEITSSSVATMSKDEKANASFSTSELLGKLLKIELDAGLEKSLVTKNLLIAKLKRYIRVHLCYQNLEVN